MTPRGPIAADSAWRPVAEAAEYRCACAGECERTHKEGRCEALHGQLTRRGPIRLYVAPHPTEERLTAFCGSCFDGVARARRRTARAEPPQTDTLF